LDNVFPGEMDQLKSYDWIGNMFFSHEQAENDIRGTPILWDLP
jgi:hypothetical protein